MGPNGHREAQSLLVWQHSLFFFFFFKVSTLTKAPSWVVLALETSQAVDPTCGQTGEFLKGTVLVST